MFFEVHNFNSKKRPKLLLYLLFPPKRHFMLAQTFHHFHLCSEMEEKGNATSYKCEF